MSLEHLRRFFERMIAIGIQRNPRRDAAQTHFGGLSGSSPETWWRMSFDYLCEQDHKNGVEMLGGAQMGSDIR